MSEDGFSDCFDEPNMEIQIKTLMGTTIDIKVSSNETIGDIKKKIYRVEGIPVYQQTIIFRQQEVKDSLRLCDAGIRHGAALTLVAAMRGGPISTRRLAAAAACEHHVVLKELKELLENSRDEITPGSKVSVLVFKEGDIINLLRVIENEDGSYSPYSEKPISPPSKPVRKESHLGVFERFVEDTEMSTKIANLRKQMAEMNLRKQSKNIDSESTKTDAEDFENKLFGEASSVPEKNYPLSFKFLAECASDLLDNVDLTVFERSLEEGNQSESEEIALKDKHRTKPNRVPKNKSLYSETKGMYSHTKHNYARMHKKKDAARAEAVSSEASTSKSSKEASPTLAEQFAILEEDDYTSESLSVSARNRVHLTRLVLSEGAERPKSSADSIELEENAQDLWEIHEPAAERLKHSATCKVGLLKRRQSLEYGYESIDNTPKPDIGNYSGKNSEFGVCSGNFYLPQFASAIPPQYAPKGQGFCDYYFRNQRSPLYGRKSNDEENDNFESSSSFLNDCSSIQRLKNDRGAESSSLFQGNDDAIDDLYGYYNLGCSAELLEKVQQQPSRIERRGEVKLPPVIKKRARCGECNKRLNITNIYNCRCGKIFCSQHRYSEVHRCGYDYKREGRKILEQQNPLVTAEKIKRI